MRAALVDRYGGPEVIRIAEVPQPVPKAGEVLVRTRAAAVTSGDARIRGARFPRGFAVPARLGLGIRGPRRKVLGVALSGVVEAVGPAGRGADSRGLRPGDAVCGMTGVRMGAHAEYIALPAGRLARVPEGVTHEDAAGVLFGGTTALFFLRDKARIRPGTTVLVNGASGAIGTNAVQLAESMGATVTAVTSTANIELVTDLGAARVIDHTAARIATIGERFDVVLDAVGNLSIATGRSLLNPGGVLLLAVADLWDLVRARGDVAAGTAPERVADYDHLLGLVADGSLRVVLEASYDLDDIAEAHRRVDTGRKVGNVLVRP